MGEFKQLLQAHWRRPAVVAALLFAGAATAAGQTESILYAFQGGNDGYYPEIYPLVLDRAGNLYGTTTYGGGGNCSFPDSTGCGMIYQLTPNPSGGSWTERTIWQFQGGADGGIPSGLALRGDKLYGEAGFGGSGACPTGCGYIFELTPPAAPGASWTKTPLFDFPTADAECGVTAYDSAGNYYGVGPSANGNGSICQLTPPHTLGGHWTEEILYVFKGVAPGQHLGDGSGPLGVTRDSHGNLWGATVDGGYCQLYEGGSCFGAIFRLTPPSTAGGAWTESVVHRFANRDQNPTSGLVMDKFGALYGVTYVETYRFLGGALTVIDPFPDTGYNARAPTGGVILDSAGNVYGTTGAGGQFDDGTVYMLTPPASGSGPWIQTILHSFAAGTDGRNPEGPLTLGPGGVLFGTTQVGGNQGCLGFQGDVPGCGTVFEIVP